MKIEIHVERTKDAFTAFPDLHAVHGVKLTSFSEDGRELGVYWSVKDSGGIAWLSDGTDRIAALESRMPRYIRAMGINAWCDFLLSRYLKEMVPLPTGALAVNFGANNGELALSLTRCGLSVLAIEPDPNVTPLLRANAAYRNIDVIASALWKEDGPLKLYVKSNTADTSAFNVSGESIMMDARRLDAIVQERGIDRIHLLIGDAEGAEPEVLEGARETLRITRYASICASDERCGQTTVGACEAILKDAGFEILYRTDRGHPLIGRNRALA